MLSFCLLQKSGRQLGVMKASAAQWSETYTVLTSDCYRMVLLSARKDRVPSCGGVKYRRRERAASPPIRAVSKQVKSVPAVCNRRVPAVLAVQALPAVVSSLLVVWTSPGSNLVYSYFSAPFHKQVLKNRKIVLVSSFHSLFIAQSFIAVIFPTNKTLLNETNRSQSCQFFGFAAE
jgi:hypothetical protein